jgi:hypothetical protein
VERELIEEIIWDAAQAPPPFSGQSPWTFNIVRGTERISAHGDQANQPMRPERQAKPARERFKATQRTAVMIRHAAAAVGGTPCTSAAVNFPPAWPEGPDGVGPPPPKIDALHDAPHETSIVAVLLSTAWL